MKKVLVTGSNGQLGSELRDLAPGLPGFEFIFLDRAALPLDDLSSLEELFKLHQPSYFINCAAYTAVDKAEEERELAYRINANAPALIARCCKLYNCHLIHISTDYVFNGRSDHPFRIDDPKGPLNVYGESKLKGEQLVVDENAEAIIIRTSWVYSSYGKNFVKTMMRLMSEKETIGVVDDQLGSPTYAYDLAAAIIEIIRSGKWMGGIYHFSNEGIISWFDFAVAIKQLKGFSCDVRPIASEAFPTPAKRPAYSAMDLAKIREVYNIEIRPWKKSLQDCIDKLS